MGFLDSGGVCAAGFIALGDLIGLFTVGFSKTVGIGAGFGGEIGDGAIVGPEV